jgi:hypothetical protein
MRSRVRDVMVARAARHIDGVIAVRDQLSYPGTPR